MGHLRFELNSKTVMHRRILGTVAAILGLLSLIPYSTVSVPEWEIQLINAQGAPFPNIPIRQEWTHVGVLGTNSETLTSDSRGRVKFPPRKFLCPVLFRTAFKILDELNSFVMPHGARVGVYARVVSPKGAYHQLEYQSGSELKHVLVVGPL